MLENLYDVFYRPNEHRELKSQIEENYHILKEHLSKEDKNRVLDIIDTTSLITALQSKESFSCGFRLAIDLQRALQDCTGCRWVEEER